MHRAHGARVACADAGQANLRLIPARKEVRVGFKMLTRSTLNRTVAAGVQSIVASAIAGVLMLMLSKPTYADDISDIQAAVTAFLQQQQQVQNPGVFYSFQVTEQLPYASAQTLLGTQGLGGEQFALSKSSGQWKILGSGGGVMSASEFIGFGIPPSNAKALQGFGCSPENRRNGPIRIKHQAISPSLRHMVMLHGPSVLPRKRVLVYFRGRMMSVMLIQPMSQRSCLL